MLVRYSVLIHWYLYSVISIILIVLAHCDSRTSEMFSPSSLVPIRNRKSNINDSNILE
jgi:hypothetical protein